MTTAATQHQWNILELLIHTSKEPHYFHVSPPFCGRGRKISAFVTLPYCGGVTTSIMRITLNYADTLNFVAQKRRLRVNISLVVWFVNKGVYTTDPPGPDPWTRTVVLRQWDKGDELFSRHRSERKLVFDRLKFIFKMERINFFFLPSSGFLLQFTQCCFLRRRTKLGDDWSTEP